MSLTQPNSIYLKNKDRWIKNRDFYDGQDQVKQKRDLYLPRLGAHKGTNGDYYYNIFLQNAVYYNTVNRTISAFLGLSFRKDLLLTNPSLTERYRQNFGSDGASLFAFAESVIKETLLQGKCGILVDFPAVDTQSLSKAEYEAQQIQSFCAMYSAESIINWKEEIRKGKKVLTLVVLKSEVINPNNIDPFSDKTVDSYTVLKLDESNEYIVETYIQVSDGVINANSDNYYDGCYLYESIKPKMQGKPLDFIPFYVVTPQGVTMKEVPSPLSPIVDLNQIHYLMSALIQHVFILCSSPTPIFSGLAADQQENLLLGGSKAILLPLQGTAQYMEYSGTSVASMQTYMQELVTRIGTLGSRILSDSATANVSAEALTITSSGQNSVLTSIIIGVSEVLTRALRIMVQWDNEKEIPSKTLESVKCQVNTDFDPSIMSANHINSISLLNQKLLLSDEETFDILKKGELIANSKTFKDHQKEIESSRFYDMVFGDLAMEAQSSIPSKKQVEDSVIDTKTNPDRFLSTENPFDPNAKKASTPDTGNPS